MANELTEIELEEVSLVDQGANPEAHVMLLKRSPLAKAWAWITGNRDKIPGEVADTLEKALEGDGKGEEESAPADIESALESAAQDPGNEAAEEPQETDMADQVAAPEADVEKGDERVEKAAFEAEIEKRKAAEAELAELKKAAARADIAKRVASDMDAVPGADADAVVEMLEKAAEVGPEFAEKLEGVLKSASELAKSAVSAPIGDDQGANADDLARFEQLVKAKQEEGRSAVIAAAEVAKENPKLAKAVYADG
jgi:hypothetical protein